MGTFGATRMKIIMDEYDVGIGAQQMIDQITKGVKVEIEIKVGDTVYIKSSSVYYGANTQTNPANLPGIVDRVDGSDVSVRWIHSGYTNSYDVSDLQHTNPADTSAPIKASLSRGDSVTIKGGKNDGKSRKIKRVVGDQVVVVISGRDVFLKPGEFTVAGAETIVKKPVKKRDLSRIAEIAPGTLGANQILGQEHAVEMLQLAADADIPALLIGETGTGKTTLVKHLAEVNNKKWARFNLTGETTVDDFVGKFILKNEETVWQDGILLQAMKDGSWLVVDEVNVALPEILFVLHSLLDDDKYVVVASNDGKVAKPHDDFRFFATMNPVDEYAGTKDLNKAFKSRFGVILNIKYPEPIIEAKIVSGRTGIEAPMAAVMVDVANKIRDLKAKEDIFYTCSTRDIIQWAKLTLISDVQSAFEGAILNKAESDYDKIKDIYKSTALAYEEKRKAGYSTNLDYLVQQEIDFKEAKKQWDEDKKDVTKAVREELISKITG